MMRIMKGRAMAIPLALALLTVAFAGLFLVEGADNPTTLSVTVTEGPIYVDDEVTFNLTGWGYEWDVGADFTVELKLNDVVTGTPTYNSDHDYFEWVWTAVAGDFEWNVSVTNNTDSMEWYTLGTFHVFAYPAFIGTSAVAMDEDVPYEWNLSAEFSGEGLTFAEEEAPENLTFAKGEGDYAIWTVTPAAEWSGTEDVKIFATDENNEAVNNTYTFTVAAVNDVPVIVGIDYMGETLVAEEMNVTVGWNETTGEANAWAMVWAIELDIEEDAMDVNFTVNATDVEDDTLTYEWEMLVDTDPYVLTPWDDFPEMFNFTADADAFGLWEANLTVSDADETVQLVWFNVAGVNDAPTIEFDEIEVGAQLEREPLKDVNVSVSVADIDSEELTIMWYIDEVEVVDWNMDYFLHNWTEDGLYNVTVEVTDGDLTSDLLYFLVNVVTPPPTWTADDVAVSYTEGSGDVVVADAEGILIYTYSNLRLATDYQGIDITAIATALEDTELVVTITFAGAPYPEWTGEDILNYISPSYKLFFVKSTFTESKFDQASPDMNFEPAEADVYSMGILWDYISGTDEMISGNNMVFRIDLADLDDAGVTKDDFNLFFIASLKDVKTSGLTITTKAGYDSAGKSAVVHLEPVVDDDDEDDDDDETSYLWLIILIIVIVVVIAIILIVVFMMKGKKEEEPEAPVEEEMPPPEEGEMPIEETEYPMEEQPPMEEGTEEPPMEQPEEPVPETPPPAPPETPMPPMPPQ